MFRVVKLFTDLQDDNHKYEVGDEYPRLGLNPSLARIEELKSANNRQGVPLIEEIADLEADKESVEEVQEEEEKAEKEPKKAPKKATPKKSAKGTK